MSEGGKAFICLPSTYNNGGTKISRIVPTLATGDIVTVPRTDVSYVVTEFGLVNLRGKSTWQRVQLLISIAHPDFRDELYHEAKNLGLGI